VTSLTAVSLFAGVGGFDLALERAGVKVVAAVEIDPKARAVLARRFPDSALFSDVTEVTAHELRHAGFIPDRGIVTGGFPCQDLSVAGRRAGLAGSRSGLFWEIVRLLDELKPRWFLLENVPGLLSSNSGRDMGVVLGALGELGYGFAYRVLDAQHFGVPQRRRRVFIVGCLGDGRRAAEVLLEPESVRGDSAQGWTAGQRVARTTSGRAGERGYTSSSHAAYVEGVGTLRANGGDAGGGSEVLVTLSEPYRPATSRALATSTSTRTSWS
jgi:DNA (cytosine-5)-methyltransferase 1